MNTTKIFLLLTLSASVNPIFAQNEIDTDSLNKQLNEVVVSANQPASRLEGSTIVSIIPGSNLSRLGNALDVLAALPMLKVEDHSVSVIGKNNVKIFIDGRPLRDQQELIQILSVNLKKVELIMAPGSEYESTTGAVLKITTLKNFRQGISFSDQFQLQRKRRWSVMDYISLNFRTGKWELFADGVFNHNNVLAKGQTVNTLLYKGDETIVGASQHNSNRSTVGYVKSGFNYSNGNLNFGAYYRFNPENGLFKNEGEEWLDNSPHLNRVIDERIHAQSHLLSLYYENMFNDRYLIHFDGDFRSAHSYSSVLTSYPDSDLNDVDADEGKKSSLLAGKLYLKGPLFKGQFTVGTQTSRTQSKLDFNMWNQQIEEYIPSTLSDMRQTSAAAFASWQRAFGNFDLSFGMRYEFMDYDFRVNGKRDNDVSRRDNLLTPDISLSYIFDNESSITLSYKMATVKPPYSQLTGALNYVGINQIEGGNPTLRDERMHDIQLFSSWKDFILQADFLRSFDTYAYVKDIYPADNLQLLMHPVNIDISAFSLYLVWKKNIRNWNPSITAGMYKQWLTLDHIRHDKPIFSYYFDNIISLPDNWLLTAKISGSTEGDMHTNRFGKNLFTMNASIGKTLLNKSLTVKLSATDIFNTSNNDWTMNTNGIYVNKCQSYDQRGISLNVIYNFQPRKSGYKGGAASQSELNRF